MNVVFCDLASGRSTLFTTGKETGSFLPRNWMVLSRFTSSSATCAILMICRHGARTRWREAISSYRASTALFMDTSRYSLYALWNPVRLW